MGTYESYQDYKNSKNNWIGNVPTHWNIQRADFLIQTNRRQVSAESLDGVELIHYSIPNVQEFGTGKLENGDQIDSAKLLISEQQLLVSKLNPRKSTLCIAVPNDQYTVVASSEFVPLLAGKTHLEYSYYVWGADKVTKLLSSMVQSVTRSHQRVNPSDILKIYWAWPPIHEQKAIARFLDHKTAQIDALIAKKQSLLDKLAEQRTALISQAVTKGLDPSVPMKDSGVDWLGEIPTHWISVRLKHVTKKIIDGAHFTPTYVSEGIPFLRVTDIVKAKGSCINKSSIKFIPEEEHAVLTRRCNPEVGDLLYSKNGTIGIPRVVDWDFEFSIFVSLCLIKLDRTRLDPHFLELALLSKQTVNQIAIGAKSNTVTNLHLDKIKEFWVALPPIEEQSQITEYLKKKVSTFNLQEEKVISVIERLKEYRSALITNAVTGKIDVRDFCIPTTTEQREVAHG